MVHLLNRQGRDTPQSHTQRSTEKQCLLSGFPFWLPLYTAVQNILPLSLIFNLITGAVVSTLHSTFLGLSALLTISFGQLLFIYEFTQVVLSVSVCRTRTHISVTS